MVGRSAGKRPAGGAASGADCHVEFPQPAACQVWGFHRGLPGRYFSNMKQKIKAQVDHFTDYVFAVAILQDCQVLMGSSVMQTFCE